jgi:hypothetical protein
MMKPSAYADGSAGRSRVFGLLRKFNSGQPDAGP